MKICPKCGAACEDEDIFCGSCGYQLKESESTGYGAKSETESSGYGDQSKNENVSNVNSEGTAEAAQEPKNNVFAVVSLVLGIVSIVTICCCGFGFLPAVAAIVFGCISRGAIRESNGRQTGLGLSTAGLVLGIITIALFIVAVIALIFVPFSSSEFEKIITDEKKFETGLMFLGLL